MRIGGNVRPVFAVLALLAVLGVILLLLGRSPLPWSRRREEPHWVRAWGGFAVLTRTSRMGTTARYEQ